MKGMAIIKFVFVLLFVFVFVFVFKSFFCFLTMAFQGVMKRDLKKANEAGVLSCMKRMAIM